MVANYCWMGVEVFSDTARTKVSNESLIGILQSFLAVYGLRKARKTREDGYYLSNLPADRHSESKEAGRLAAMK